MSHETWKKWKKKCNKRINDKSFKILLKKCDMKINMNCDK